MDLLDWPLKIAIAFALGSVIGLEREINEQKDLSGDKKDKHAILGLRTFSLIGGLGALTGFLSFAYPVLAGLLAAAVFLLLITFYVFDNYLTKDIGMTTEISVLYTYILGVLVATNLLPVQLLVAVTVVVILLMSRKEDIKNFVGNIRKSEMNALVSFAILAFVILPFLPNYTYALNDFKGIEEFLRNIGWSGNSLADLELINPFKLWLIVVLITGVDLLGYILERTIGQSKGWLVASLVGGFVSSTATTISIAQESKTSKNTNPLIAGAILATLVSFLPVAILLGSLNVALFIAFIPVLAAISLASFAVGIYFLKATSGQKNTQKVDTKKIDESYKIFSLVSALRFMGIYLLINVSSKIAIEFFGSSGFLVTSAIGSLTGIDAVVINTAQLAGSRIDLSLGVWALVMANGVNLMAKSVYSFLQGSREFALKYLTSMLIIIGVSIAAAFIL
jgi:uncharacterized membrane protein (DUF4010 family)